MKGDVIPPAAWARSLHIAFGMAAARRGPHWSLRVIPAEQNPFGNEPLDEGMMLGESLAAVMSHVPLPTRELGIVNDLTVCAFAFYSAINSRLEMDRFIASQTVRARPAGPARPVEPLPFENRPAPESNGEVTAAELMEGLTREHEAPLAAVTHEQTGDPVADKVQLGYAATDQKWETGRTEDPEPVLLEAFRPGETPVPITTLAADGDGDVLDRLAPPIEVEGKPAARELGDSQAG